MPKPHSKMTNSHRDSNTNVKTDRYAIPSESECEPDFTAYLSGHTKPSSTYTRSANHVTRYRAKVDERFVTMMSTLKGHKSIREHKSPGQQREQQDKDYYNQRCEKLMQIPKVIGPNDVKYTGK